MGKKKLLCVMAAAVLCMGMLSGCTDEHKEKQTAYRQIGINDMENGDYEGAVAAFDSALSQCIGEIGENELDICYYKAAAQFAGGDAAGAAATYTAIIEYDKKEADAYYLRGCVCLKQGDADSAVTDFDNAVKYHANDYELYVNIYENLSAYDMTEKGEEYLNQAFSVKGNEGEDLAWRGRIYYLLGQYDNAAEELKAAIEKKSEIAGLYLAQVYEAQGDTENAQTYYENYVNSGKADAEALNSLAEIEMQKENYSGALTYLEQGIAMENASNKRALMQNMIICYEYTGNFGQAWNLIQEYVQVYPEDENANREYTFLQNRVEQQEPQPEDTQTPEDTQMPEETDEGTQTPA